MDIISLQLEELGLTHEKNYDMMLRRLSGGRDTAPLRTFVDAVEPVKQYNRNRQRPHTSLSPLTRVVDAARPDARIARDFRRTVDRYLETRGDADADVIRHSLQTWQANHARLELLATTSPGLKEVIPLSGALAKLSNVGLQALDLLTSGKDDQNLPSASAETLKAAREPHGQVELAVVSAIEKLVAEASQPGSTR
jgi:hexosaminidase